MGGHGGEKVAAECCLHPRVRRDDLFVSINKDRGGENEELLDRSRSKNTAEHMLRYTHYAFRTSYVLIGPLSNVSGPLSFPLFSIS